MGNTCKSESSDTKPEQLKILIVCTSHDKLGDSGKQTGWYLSEVAHPYEVFKKASIEMVFASPKGGVAPVDEGSVAASKEDALCMSFIEGEDTKALVDNTVALKDIDASEFDGVFYAGGFGTMWDFPEDPDVQRIARQVYDQGGVVSAVCHGPCALVNVKLGDGSLLVKDKEVAAFTNEEEDEVKCREFMKWTCEDKLTEIGAKYTKGGVWATHVAVADRLITGQNPQSAGPTAEAVVKNMMDKAAKDKAAKDKAAKDKAVKDKAAKDKAAKDKVAKDNADKDKADKDKADKDKEDKDKAAEDKAAKDKAAKDKAKE